MEILKVVGTIAGVLIGIASMIALGIKLLSMGGAYTAVGIVLLVILLAFAAAGGSNNRDGGNPFS